VVLGPQSDGFTREALERLLSETYRLETTSDRTGCRLSGPLLTHTGSAEIVSDGMLPGSIQVPPDGQPIVMLADSPTTGGYAKIGTVVTSDLPRLAQLLPGEGRVSFVAEPS
jgi:allophanate hydrolase subunit 2